MKGVLDYNHTFSVFKLQCEAEARYFDLSIFTMIVMYRTFFEGQEAVEP